MLPAVALKRLILNKILTYAGFTIFLLSSIVALSINLCYRIHKPRFILLCITCAKMLIMFKLWQALLRKRKTAY